MVSQGRQSSQSTLVVDRWIVTDLLLMIWCGFLTWVLKTFGHPQVRSVALDSEAYNKPRMPDIISEVSVICIGLFSCFFALMLVEGSQLKWDAKKVGKAVQRAGWCIVEAFFVTLFVTEVFKNLAGRPRPYFAEVCVSYSDNLQRECTGNALQVREARKSFPSGHTSVAFCFATILSLYIRDKLRLGETEPRTWKTLVLLFPLLSAFWVAVSRTLDFHHHWSGKI